MGKKYDFIREVLNMKKMTADNLASAYAGESQAHMKYTIYSEVAEKENMPNIARLFKAISHAELVHAGRLARRDDADGAVQPRRRGRASA